MPPRLTTPSLFAEPAPEPGPKPRDTWIHAHCDGGARGNPGPAGYGALVQDDHGKVLAELSEFLGIHTNNFAEYSGLLGCLQYALDHDYRRLKVVSDSELMVKQIQGKYKVKSPELKSLYDEAKRRIARLEAFEITHALRHKNKDADRLANEAMDRGMKRDGPIPAKTTPYPKKAEAPPIPISLPNPPAKDSAPTLISAPAPAATMLRGFTRDGAIHILGSKTLPDGIFVKIIPE